MRLNTRKIKPFVLPLAMLCGILFHSWIGMLRPVVPYLIFTMLLITFCNVRPSQLRVTALSGSLLVIQLGLSALCYFTVRIYSEDVAQALFICILCPTATAAPVVTGMLGGNVARLTTYSIVINLCVALVAPICFAFMGTHSEMTFAQGFMNIAVMVAPLILLPLVIAFTLYLILPPVHKAIARVQSVSFYLWAVSLIVAVGGSVSYVMAADRTKIPEIIVIALVAGVACALQFAIGRWVGRKCGDKIAGAQALGQKNTILAIWMALTYLNPISSVGPAAYIAWQNTVNSVQLYLKTRRESEQAPQVER